MFKSSSSSSRWSADRLHKWNWAAEDSFQTQRGLLSWHICLFYPNFMPEKKLTKREKKAAAFRNRKKDSGALSEANAVPESDIQEDQQQVSTTEQKSDRSSTKHANDDASQDKPAKKKRRSRGGKGNNEGGDKKRFILFVGNLPKDTTSQQLAAHFESVGELPTVRLMTHKETNEPKGFAFVEFKESETLNVSGWIKNPALGKGKLVS